MALLPSLCSPPPCLRQVDGIGNLLELNGRFAAELDSPVLMVSRQAGVWWGRRLRRGCASGGKRAC